MMPSVSRATGDDAPTSGGERFELFLFTIPDRVVLFPALGVSRNDQQRDVSASAEAAGLFDAVFTVQHFFVLFACVLGATGFGVIFSREILQFLRRGIVAVACQAIPS